ncbi:MAG: MBL fold metallo-hydrolase [Candidatus Dormibacteraeota bacterium]|nr:MBL fold metallo-hydrolase [Candidatus Dormibacteraeota bacterium]
MLEGFTWFKQSAYLWKGGGLSVYIDPWEVTTSDPADLIVITHAHFDHFSPDDIERVRTPKTVVVAPRDVAQEIPGQVVAVAPGEVLEAAGVHLETVPAYNVAEERLEAHPRANGWVGYLLTLGGHTYYHAGDTDHVPELDRIRTEVAFLPIGGTFTMDVEEAAGLARAISPRLAVPMHYGFVVGAEHDAEDFARLAAPVEVRTLTPLHPFSQ